MMVDELKQQLAAAEEQLAVMRKLIKREALAINALYMEFEDTRLLDCQLGLEEALSAAPKRGRVIYRVKRRAKVYANGWAEVAGIRIEPSIGIVDTEEFTVTVREAESSQSQG